MYYIAGYICIALNTVFRDIQLLKLTRIIGLDPEKVKDPDPSYVLTPDNLMKMLAVVMRLRYRMANLCIQ